MNGFQANLADHTFDASVFADGATVGIGSVPYLDATAAAAFSIGEFDIATVPSLPRRSIAETMLAQAVGGIDGIDIDDAGTPVVTGTTGDFATHVDLTHEAFVGLQAFTDLAGRIHLDGAPIKWQFVGPVTLGVALYRAGLDAAVAFDVALRAVRTNIAAISARLAAILPTSPQLMLLDEPSFGALMQRDFPIAPDHAADLMAGAMAAAAVTTRTGVHCCAPCDVATLLAAGPTAISLPVSSDLLAWSGYLGRYLDDGGIIIWGAVPTDGPVPSTDERPWRALSDVWCGLVQRGCDPVLLRRQGLVSPQCGLAWHAVPIARRIARLTGDVGRRVKDQSAATRFALGA